MAIRETKRGDHRVLVIDIIYRTPPGERPRYLRDAQVQMKTAARAEHDRLMRQLGLTGEIPFRPAVERVKEHTFEDAVDYYEEHVAPTLKQSTRSGYETLLDGPVLTTVSKLSLGHFVTSLLRNGVGAHVVQTLAGHHSLAVTQRYAHADADDLRQAVATLVGGSGVETGSSPAC